MRLLIGLIVIFSSGEALAGQSKNLIPDPDFDQTKPAFLTGYIQTTNGIVYEDHYAVGSDASQFNSNWPSTIQPQSGDSTKAAISIVDENTQEYGNDFALDNLSLANSPIFISGPHVITMRFAPAQWLRPEASAFNQP